MADEGREVKCAVAYKARDNFKARIRQLTRRLGGHSMERVVAPSPAGHTAWEALVCHDLKLSIGLRIAHPQPTVFFGNGDFDHWVVVHHFTCNLSR